MEIIRAGMQEAGRAAALAQLLWPGHAQAELEQELAGYLQGPEGAVFLAREDGADVGFAQCGLRRDYVEGTHTSPVGYLEGVFVQEESGHQKPRTGSQLYLGNRRINWHRQ